MIQTFKKAQELGLSVLRMWAFADGATEWNALQPELGLLDDKVLSCASCEGTRNICFRLCFWSWMKYIRTYCAAPVLHGKALTLAA